MYFGQHRWDEGSSRRKTDRHRMPWCKGKPTLDRRILGFSRKEKTKTKRTPVSAPVELVIGKCVAERER